MLSGRIQKKGITVMSWQILFVTARSTMQEPTERVIQRRSFFGVSFSLSCLVDFSVVSVLEGACFHRRAAQQIVRNANTARPIDHVFACSWRVRNGSMRKG